MNLVSFNVSYFFVSEIIAIESCEMVIYNHASFMPYQVAGNKADYAVGDLATGAGE